MANPFIAGPITQVSKSYTANLPELQELAWDFNHDTFVHDNDGRLKTVTGNEALKVWIYKALKTERYRYMAYLHGDYNAEGNYGTELERFIGTRPNSEISATEIEEIHQGWAPGESLYQERGRHRDNRQGWRKPDADGQSDKRLTAVHPSR